MALFNILFLNKSSNVITVFLFTGYLILNLVVVKQLGWANHFETKKSGPKLEQFLILIIYILINIASFHV